MHIVRGQKQRHLSLSGSGVMSEYLKSGNLGGSWVIIVDPPRPWCAINANGDRCEGSLDGVECRFGTQVVVNERPISAGIDVVELRMISEVKF
jgi:hypothetical protein